MKRTVAALSGVALLMLLLGAAGSAGAATPGFAMYTVQLASHGSSYSFTVNETVATTSSPSSDNLILKIATGTWNLNYSRSINASDQVSPFLPSVTNQTFSISTAKGNLSVAFVKAGSSTLQFQGKSYTMASYSLTASSASNKSKTSLDGIVTTFPSGLVYSVNLNASYPTFPVTTGHGWMSNGSLPFSFPLTSLGAALPTTGTASVSLTLTSTSLPLNAAGASSAAQVASIGIGAGAAVSALAIALGVRYRGKHNNTAPENKPEHWVD